MKWQDRMPWSYFFECSVSSQLFHSPLSPSSRGSWVPLHFLPVEWYHLHIWGCWFLQIFMQKSPPHQGLPWELYLEEQLFPGSHHSPAWIFSIALVNIWHIIDLTSLFYHLSLTMWLAHRRYISPPSQILLSLIFFHWAILTIMWQAQLQQTLFFKSMLLLSYQSDTEINPKLEKYTNTVKVQFVWTGERPSQPRQLALRSSAKWLFIKYIWKYFIFNNPE